MSGSIIAVSQKSQEIAAELERELEKVAGGKVAFSLFVFAEGKVSYVSNTKDRSEIIAGLETIIAKWKDGMPDIPLHKRN